MDNYSHIIGDNILKEIANTFKRIKEPNHFIGRYGGEEFIYMIESNDYNEVLEIAKHLRTSVKGLGNDMNLPLSISIGLAYKPQTLSKNINLLSIADQLHYEAKSEVKNKIVSKVIGL